MLFVKYVSDVWFDHREQCERKLKDPERVGGIDVIGNAYEYLIGRFASDAGKKAGECHPAQGFQAEHSLITRIVSHEVSPVLKCSQNLLLICVGAP
jgi:hypothetical protein